MCLVAFSKTPRYAALEKLDGFSGIPKWAYTVITDRCSHRCPWCYGGFDTRGRDMSVDEFDVIIGKLRDIGVSQITISGGEPTEHPRFLDFLRRASGFHLHVASHGEHIDAALAQEIADCGVRQVQINFQGSRFHDRIHGSGYSEQLVAIEELRSRGVEITTTVTVGKYNIDYIGEIFGEAAGLGATRLRVWETTGRGGSFLRDLDALAVFERCAAAAKELGFEHSLSYDPVYPGEVHIPCLQLSNLYFYIDSACDIRMCGAVVDAPIIANFIEDSAEKIVESYLTANRTVLGDRSPWCLARGS